MLLTNKKVSETKLINFGFKKINKNYIYKKLIVDDEFELTVTVNNTGEIKTNLVELETGDIYTLHLSDAEGAFVGRVRSEYELVLNEILTKCYDKNVFKSEFSYKVIDYLKEKYDDDMEYLWDKFPDNAIARRKDNKKWYLALLTVSRDKFGFKSKEKVEVLDLRINTERLDKLLSMDNIYPAYHMNKKHWISIILDGSMRFDEIIKYIDNSYLLAKK